jgi:release factor glutamine methyltransferase
VTIHQSLQAGTQQLERVGIETARLDCLVLLEDVTGYDRAWMLAHDDQEIEPDKQRKLNKLLKQRAQHLPLAYVRGKGEFYGREFVLTPAVLAPRPESETMIDLLKDQVIPALKVALGPKKLRLADVGTGSGALGITALLEAPDLLVDLLEIDKNAAEIAQMNVDKLTPDISVILSDLLTATRANYDILLCNLPYVPDDYQINTAATHEPSLAIFGGPDGLDIYRKLFLQLEKRTFRPLFILTESLPRQHERLAEIARTSNYDLLRSHDFIQVFQLSKTTAVKANL